MSMKKSIFSYTNENKLSLSVVAAELRVESI